MIVIAAVWLSFVIPLIVAAVARNRPSTKVAALLALAVVLAASWLAAVTALSVLSAHEDPAGWPSPLTLAAAVLCIYLSIMFAALQRKLR